MFAVERLERVLNKAIANSQRNKSNENALSRLKDLVEQGGENGVLNIINLISNAKEEVVNCEFRREGRQDDFLSQLSKIEKGFVEALVSSNTSSLHNWFFSSRSAIQVICASVTEALDADVFELDRPAFVGHTQTLIAEVQDWEIDEFAKKNLLLSLNLVCQQAQAEAISSTDAEVRRRIKLVVASFAVEFAELDKEFESRWEKIKRWAKFGYVGASVPLGLTSDAAAVVGLLEGPK